MHIYFTANFQNLSNSVFFVCGASKLKLREECKEPPFIARIRARWGIRDLDLQVNLSQTPARCRYWDHRFWKQHPIHSLAFHPSPAGTCREQKIILLSHVARYAVDFCILQQPITIHGMLLWLHSTQASLTHV